MGQIKNLNVVGPATPLHRPRSGGTLPALAQLRRRHARLELQSGNEERSRRKASFTVKGGFGLWSFEDGSGGGAAAAHDAQVANYEKSTFCLGNWAPKR